VDANLALIVLTAAAVGNSVGFFCATLFREIRRVSALTSIVMIPLFVLSGLFNKLNFMPDWSSWLQYISPFRYGLHLLLENGFGDQVFNNYDYKADLGINLSYGVNWLILLGQGLFFYSASFFLLKFYTARIAA
jgi:ABC-type polysaccharide/polyol phosphate export permease